MFGIIGFLQQPSLFMTPQCHNPNTIYRQCGKFVAKSAKITAKSSMPAKFCAKDFFFP
jgi:hypothetical protein